MRKETGKQVVKTDNKPISGNLISNIRRLIETARQMSPLRLTQD